MLTSTTVNKQNPFGDLSLPEPNLHKLTFCGSKPRQLQQWLEQLPNAQANHTSVLLYKLLPEINHLDIPSAQRLGLLSILRPYIHRCIEGLAKEFLKQPLHLNATTGKIAAIAQALQRHLCDGYLLAIQQLLSTHKLSESQQQALLLSLYYGIQGCGELFYRGCQLYIPRPPLLWKKLNRLFQLAIEYECLDTPIHDELIAANSRMSIKQSYLRAVALACSNTNQLRQIDIHYTYHGLAYWSKDIQLKPNQADTSSLYCIDLDADDGPIYKQRYNGTPSSQLLAIDFEKLAKLLEDPNNPAENQHTQDIPSHRWQSLLPHLLNCWQHPQERLLSRRPTNITLDICVGLKAAHQQLLHGESFDDFLSSRNTNLQTTDMGFTMSSFKAENIYYEAEPSHSILAAIATDASEEGYCLRWEGMVPPQIKTGEFILVRPKDAENWQTGTVRWAQRLNHHTYVGIQLLPGYAEASAACTTLHDGKSTPYFRTVLLCDKHSTNSSLLTPAVPFAPKQHVQIHSILQDEKAQLTQLLMSSGSVSHYAFRHL